MTKYMRIVKVVKVSDMAIEQGSTSPSVAGQFFKKFYKITSCQLGLLAVLILYSIIGALMFQCLEGPYEDTEKVQIEDLRGTIIKDMWRLWNQKKRVNETAFSEAMEEELQKYEGQIQSAFAGGINTDSETRNWDFWGSFFYCATVFTTVGYGNFSPATDAGRIATIIYGLIGIPLCLVVLNELGKLLTKAIKYPYACMSQCKNKKEEGQGQTENEAIVVDDEFNLPIAVALLVTVVYIFLGALMYMLWEDWDYLEAFYFVFITISTVGFGDVLPGHPKLFIATSIYMLFGLALVAMVLNVIMEAVGDSLAKAKTTVFSVGNQMGIQLDPDAMEPDVPEPEVDEDKKKS